MGIRYDSRLATTVLCWERAGWLSADGFGCERIGDRGVVLISDKFVSERDGSQDIVVCVALELLCFSHLGSNNWFP